MAQLKDIDRISSLSAVALDESLTREIQQQLIELKILDPPVDGILGPLTTAAYHRFQIIAGIKGEENALGPKTARGLLGANPDTFPRSAIAIRAVRNTVFKLRPLQSTDLKPEERLEIKDGEGFVLTDYEAGHRSHYRITVKEPINKSYVWYAFDQHVEILENDKLVATPSYKPKSVRLNVPYKSQNDNWYNPGGSCNVTSIAMCLEYLGVPRYDYRFSQFEDELYQWCLDRGYSRHSPEDLARVVRDYRRRDDFTYWGTIERCKEHLRGGNPCVIHGYFTSFGHIIVLVGFDDDGFIVHDPYGEWFPTGYDRWRSGANLHYSYNLISRLCIDDQFWVHYISR